MKLPRLTYANVVATLALFVALGGGAYALSNGGVKSKHIRDNTIKSADVKDRSGSGKKSGLRAKDIQFDSLGGEEINEDSLDVSEFLRLGNVGGGGTCTLTGALSNCGEATVNVPKGDANVLVIATGGYESVGSSARAFCKVDLDGVNTGAVANPGEATSDNTSSGAYESFTMIGKSSGVSKGIHTLRMLCSESGGNAVINSPSIIGLALGTGP
jgi:hypothetical protein